VEETVEDDDSDKEDDLDDDEFKDQVMILEPKGFEQESFGQTKLSDAKRCAADSKINLLLYRFKRKWQTFISQYASQGVRE
jgi:hypothetical protein